MIIEDSKRSVEIFNKVCWVTDSSMYMSMFVIYAEHGISIWRMVSETCLLSDSFSSLCVSSTMLKESQGSTQVSRERAKCSLSLVHLTNVEKGNNSVGN